MARRKRKPITIPAIPRTLERIAIAALAAVATRGEKESVGYVAVTIFVILVVIEELGRRWVWHGQRVTLRDVALGSVGDLRLFSVGALARARSKRKRARARSGRSNKAARKGDAKRGSV